MHTRELPGVYHHHIRIGLRHVYEQVIQYTHCVCTLYVNKYIRNMFAHGLYALYLRTEFTLCVCSVQYACDVYVSGTVHVHKSLAPRWGGGNYWGGS